MDLNVFNQIERKDHEILWQSKCHGSNKIMNYLFFIPLLLIIALPFTIHFMGFGTIAIVELVLLAISLVVLLVIYRALFRWENPNLIFVLTEEGLFMSNTNPKDNSYVSVEMLVIQDYTFKQEKGNLTTITINFKGCVQAGYFGKTTSLKMVKIENFEKLQQVFAEHGIQSK